MEVENKNNEENIENNKQKEVIKKKNTNLILILVLVLLVVIGCVVLIIYNKRENNTGNKAKNSEQKEENTETSKNNVNDNELNKDIQFDINRLYYSLHEEESETTGKGLEQKIYSQAVTYSSELTGEDLSRIIIKNLESKINELKIDDSQFTLSNSDGEIVDILEYEFLIPYNEASEIFREYIHSIFGDYLPFNDSLLDSNGKGFTVYGENYAFHNGINIGKSRYSYAFDKEVNEGKNIYIYEKVNEYPINTAPGSSSPTNQYVYRWVYELNEDENYYLLKIERVNE